MEPTAENIAAFQDARWRLKVAKIAAAMHGGWPLNLGTDSEEYRLCRKRVEDAEAELARYPESWGLDDESRPA